MKFLENNFFKKNGDFFIVVYLIEILNLINVPCLATLVYCNQGVEPKNISVRVQRTRFAPV